MISIGELAKLANVSPRTIRHYESIGLIKSNSRGENNYRYFDKKLIKDVSKIRDMQSLGFSLTEIREVLSLGASDISLEFSRKLASVETDILELNLRRDRLKELLTFSKKIDQLDDLNQTERGKYMELLRQELLENLRSKKINFGSQHLNALTKEGELYASEEKLKFLDAVKSCLKFAKDNSIKLGYGRGSSASSLTMFGLGVSFIDPVKYDLVPERLWDIPFDLHLDVEYENGQKFVDYCQKISKSLLWGEINAFKMPLINILDNVHSKMSKMPNYSILDENDPSIIEIIKKGDIEKIFLLDNSPNAIVMKFEDLLPEYVGLEKLKQYLKTINLNTFNDIINLLAVWRPSSPMLLTHIDNYQKANNEPLNADFLGEELKSRLVSSYGMILYHEDLIRVMQHFSNWDAAKCNQLRRDMKINKKSSLLDEFKETVPTHIFDIFTKNYDLTFCKSHLYSHTQFTRQTAYLKANHRELYLSEVEKWESKFGLMYDEIGIKIKGVSILQS